MFAEYTAIGYTELCHQFLFRVIGNNSDFHIDAVLRVFFRVIAMSCDPRSRGRCHALRTVILSVHVNYSTAFCLCQSLLTFFYPETDSMPRMHRSDSFFLFIFPIDKTEFGFYNEYIYLFYRRSGFIGDKCPVTRHTRGFFIIVR